MWQKSFQFLISLKLNTAMSMSSVSWHVGETIRHRTVVCYWWQPSKTHLTNILLLLKKCYPIHFFFQKEWSCHFSSYWCKYPTILAISTKGQCSPKHLCVHYTPEKWFFSLKIAVFCVYRVILQPSVKNANTLPNKNTEFDIKKCFKTRTQARKAARVNMGLTQCTIIILIQHPQKRFICSSRCLLFIVITNDHPRKKTFTSKNLILKN